MLDPADFGLAAMMTVVIGLATALADAGIGDAIIARQVSRRDHLSSLYWANVLIGVATAALVLASTPLLTAFYAEPRLAELVPFAAAVFVMAPLGRQFAVLLQKDLRFRTLARVETVSALASPVVAIPLAIAGAGAASILSGLLASTAVKAGMLVWTGWRTWRPSLRLKADDLREYVGFGLNRMGERLTTYLGSNVDYILIGRFLGVEALGIYSIPFQLVIIPQTRLNPVLTRVAFPIFARRQRDDAALRRGFLELTQLVAFVTFPLMAGVAVVAPELVPVVFGPQWAASVPILQIVSILGALFALGNTQGPIYLAKNRPDLSLKISLGRLAVLSAAVYLVVTSGLINVAWTYVVVIAGMFVVARIMLERLIGLSPLAYLKTLASPLLAALTMAAVVLGSTLGLERLLGSPSAVVLVLQVVIGAGTYGLFLLWRERPYLLAMWRLLFPRGARTGEPA